MLCGSSGLSQEWQWFVWANAPWNIILMLKGKVISTLRPLLCSKKCTRPLDKYSRDPKVSFLHIPIFNISSVNSYLFGTTNAQMVLLPWSGGGCSYFKGPAMHFSCLAIWLLPLSLKRRHRFLVSRRGFRSSLRNFRKRKQAITWQACSLRRDLVSIGGLGQAGGNQWWILIKL